MSLPACYPYFWGEMIFAQFSCNNWQSDCNKHFRYKFSNYEDQDPTWCTSGTVQAMPLRNKVKSWWTNTAILHQILMPAFSQSKITWTNRQWHYEPSQTSIFQYFTFLHILKAYVRIYQLAKSQVVILLKFCINYLYKVHALSFYTVSQIFLTNMKLCIHGSRVQEFVYHVT